VLDDPSQVGFYAQKPPLAREREWEEAIRRRPDEVSVPALAIGYDELRKRYEVQEKVTGIHRAKLEELSERLNAISKDHSLNLAPKLGKLLNQTGHLGHRILAMVAVLHQLLPTRGSLVSAGEEETFRALGGMEAEGRAVGRRMGEVWTGVGKRRMGMLGGRGEGREEEWAVRDEEGVKAIMEVSGGWSNLSFGNVLSVDL
jgi:nuclear pore complex protein Nup54